jgi:hypothetical protein
MHDQPYPSGIKPPVDTDPNSASSGFVRTDPKTQTIKSGPVDELAQDYKDPEFR